MKVVIILDFLQSAGLSLSSRSQIQLISIGCFCQTSVTSNCWKWQQRL